MDEKERSENCEVRKPAPDPEKEDQVMLQRPRISRIYFRRNFFPYPIGITLKIAWRLGLLNTALIGFSYIKAQMFPRKDETYLDAFMINRFGMRLYKTFFEDYTEKVWGVPCSQIRADWGAQRIKGLSLRRAIVHAVKDLLSSEFAKAQEERETSLITRFFYPKFGPGQMWETVAMQLDVCGGEVRMHHKVVGIRHVDGVVVSATVENTETGETQEIECDYFFSTMPVKHLIAGMNPEPPQDVQDVAKGLIYRDFLTVGLLLKKLHVQEKGKKPQDDVPDNWIYVQDRGVKVGRIQIFNNWSPYMVSDSSTKWIGLEYFVDEGDELWVKKDEDMIAQGISEMEEIGFIQKEDVLDACVLRMLKAYPAYFGTYDQLDIIENYSLEFSNLFLIGRNGMHRYNNQDHSMLTAMTAVDNIAAGITDHKNIWEVNAERVYHEEKGDSEQTSEDRKRKA
jgi:protoporphyrinogen oxidase